MRVAVISEMQAGSHRAHAINVVKTAGGFHRLGHRVTILCRAPQDPEPDLSAMFGEPGVEWSFAPERADFGRWAADAADHLSADMVYARNFEAPLRTSLAGIPTVLETHAHIGDPNPAIDLCMQATRRPGHPLAAVITINRRLREHFIRRGADPERVHVIPDGVDVELFSPPAVFPPAPWLGDADDRPRAVYAGHLYDYKGIPTVLDAAAVLPDWVFELVGGAPEDIARWSEAIGRRTQKNVRLRGHVPHAEVPRWLWRAGALLLPPSGRDPSAAWTSPVKLGEYLASGPPIVASDIPGLRDWVDGSVVRWVTPDDPAALAGAIAEVAKESARDSAARRAAASRLADQYSYRRRAQRILHAAGAGGGAFSALVGARDGSES